MTVEELEAQGVLNPGEAGWWKVWGASVADVLPGDLVGSKVDGEVTLDLVEGTFESKAAPLRVGFVVDGKRVTFGALAPIVLFRRGTGGTLAASLTSRQW